MFPWWQRDDSKKTGLQGENDTSSRSVDDDAIGQNDSGRTPMSTNPNGSNKHIMTANNTTTGIAK